MKLDPNMSQRLVRHETRGTLAGNDIDNRFAEAGMTMVLGRILHS